MKQAMLKNLISGQRNCLRRALQTILTSVAGKFAV